VVNLALELVFFGDKLHEKPGFVALLVGPPTNERPPIQKMGLKIGYPDPSFGLSLFIIIFTVT
jgi:hypothetical protein